MFRPSALVELLRPYFVISSSIRSQLPEIQKQMKSQLESSLLLVRFVAVLSLLPAILQAQSNEDCLMCHRDPRLTTVRGEKEISLFVHEGTLKSSTHRKLKCVACHTGFDPSEVPHKAKIEPISCLTCHRDAPIKHSFHPQMIRASETNGKPDQSCKGSHGTHGVISLKVSESKFHSTKLVETCGSCHAAVKESFNSSAHFMALTGGIKGAPDCLTCHRNSIARPGPARDSTQLKVAQEKLCLSCHLDDPNVRARTAPSAGFIAAYENSVHGSALLRGNGKAANCVDCHGSHQMKKSLDPSALVNKHHIPETCATCHPAIAAVYNESVHGIAVAKGNKDSPVCTNCHGEHSILPHTDPRSPVWSKNISSQVCSPCHSSMTLTVKYGLSSDRFQTYADTYHGLATRGGSVEVANCASCHGAHNIRRSRDPRSSVNNANLAVTCGSCHPGANARFAVGSVHVVIAEETEPALYWISTLYLILIVTLVGGMFAHNVASFVKKARRKLKLRRGLATEERVSHRLYLRMTMSERLQHGSLMVSFILLVITGFMFRYPEAWWVAGIRNLSSGIFDLRSLVHRIAAVVMIGSSLYHLYYISFTQRGRELIHDLLPRQRDLTDASVVLKYNFGFSTINPKFGRFSYIEKSEYWALVWGTLIMALTGFVMWFDNTFIGLLTKLGYDIARAIHFYEAWLATLAILVWHLYYVIFNPDSYPMNLAWFTGTLSEAEMEDEHPLELERIRKRDESIETKQNVAASDSPDHDISPRQTKPNLR